MNTLPTFPSFKILCGLLSHDKLQNQKHTLQRKQQPTVLAHPSVCNALNIVVVNPSIISADSLPTSSHTASGMFRSFTMGIRAPSQSATLASALVERLYEQPSPSRCKKDFHGATGFVKPVTLYLRMPHMPSLRLACYKKLVLGSEFLWNSYGWMPSLGANNKLLLSVCFKRPAVCCCIHFNFLRVTCGTISIVVIGHLNAPNLFDMPVGLI